MLVAHSSKYYDGYVMIKMHSKSKIKCSLFGLLTITSKWENVMAWHLKGNLFKRKYIDMGSPVGECKLDNENKMAFLGCIEFSGRNNNIRIRFQVNYRADNLLKENFAHALRSLSKKYEFAKVNLSNLDDTVFAPSAYLHTKFDRLICPGGLFYEEYQRLHPSHEDPGRELIKNLVVLICNFVKINSETLKEICKMFSISSDKILPGIESNYDVFFQKLKSQMLDKVKKKTSEIQSIIDEYRYELIDYPILFIAVANQLYNMEYFQSAFILYKAIPKENPCFHFAVQRLATLLDMFFRSTTNLEKNQKIEYLAVLLSRTVVLDKVDASQKQAIKQYLPQSEEINLSFELLENIPGSYLFLVRIIRQQDQENQKIFNLNRRLEAQLEQYLRKSENRPSEESIILKNNLIDLDDDVIKHRESVFIHCMETNATKETVQNIVQYDLLRSENATLALTELNASSESYLPFLNKIKEQEADYISLRQHHVFLESKLKSLRQSHGASAHFWNKVDNRPSTSPCMSGHNFSM